MMSTVQENKALVVGGMGQHIIISRVLPFLAMLYKNSVSVISEYVDNGLDAGANRIWVVVEPTKITVIDNGHGMVPGFLPEDAQTISMFFEDIEMGRMTADFDLRPLLHRASLCSLRWMMENIAFSPRLLLGTDTSSVVRGMRGIGALAFRQIARSAVISTRPSKDLAQEHGGIVTSSGSIPLLVLVPPTEAQLNGFDTTYNVYDGSNLPEGVEVGSLEDPNGKALEHGTRIEISSLREGADRNLRPNLIVEHLRSRFSVELGRRRDLEIAVIDRATTAGRKSARGRIIKVDPPPLKGVEVHNATHYTLDGKKFEVHIRWVVEGRAESIGLVRQGDVVTQLTDLPEFKRSPWDSGKLTGFVEFPSVPPNEDGLHWSTDKHTLLDSPLRTQWRENLWHLEGDLKKSIVDVERASQQDDLRELQINLGAAADVGLSQVDVFGDIEFIGKPTGPIGTRRPSSPPETIEATVFNEHNQGVEGVRVEVTRGGDLVQRKDTGSSGRLSFRNPERIGVYRVRMFCPRNAIVLGETFYEFRFPRERGIRAVFRLQTGAPAPQARTRKKLTPWFEHMSNPDVLYSLDYMDAGRLQINLGETEMNRAIKSGDMEERNRLACQYMAMALTQYCLPEQQPEQLFLHSSRLCSAIYRNFRERSATKTTISQRRK